MKLGVLVSGGLGYNCLQKLYSEYEISFVLTDKGSSAIVDFCNSKNLLYYAGNPRNGKASVAIQAVECDVILSINYLFIVEPDIIAKAKIIAINFHGSLLPKYRGRTPHVWAIINNETETGITAHVIDKDCDTGDIIMQIRLKIGPKNTGADILSQFNAIYPTLVFEVLESVVSKTYILTPQNHTGATYFHKRTPNDGHINWNWQRERINNWVRAQAKPYPGAFAFYNGIKISIHKIEFDDYGFDQLDVNGKIIDIDKNFPIVKTENGCIRITEFEPRVLFEISNKLE